MAKNEKVTKKLAYYEDDYTRRGTIPEDEFLPEVKFEYKPLNMLQSANLTDDVMNGEGIVGAAQASIKMLAKHLVSWNLVKADDSTVDCNDMKSLRKIDGRLLQKIAGFIRGDHGTLEADAEAIEESIKNL